MGTLPLPAVIGWLVHERFGGYDAETKLRGDISRLPAEQRAEADTFRRLLQSQTEEHVREMFSQRLSALIPEADASILDREATLFFNRPCALPVYPYWGRMPLWSVCEAAALTLDRDPRFVNWQAFEAEGVTATPFAVSYRNVENLISRSVAAGLLDAPLEPSLYLEWCHQMGLAPPAELVAEVEKLRGARFHWEPAYWRLHEMHQETLRDIQAWADAYADLASEHEATLGRLGETQAFAMRTLQQLDAERAEHANEIEALRKEISTAAKNLGPRERESVLKALLSATIYGLGYAPFGGKSPIPGQIAAEAERLGIPVSDATVLKWLRAATELLPTDDANVSAA